MEPDNTLYLQILGGLYGQALANAWAMPSYFHPDVTWSRYSYWIDTLLPAADDHPLYAGFQAGQVTEDVYQTIAQAEAILNDGGVTAEGTAEYLERWFDTLDDAALDRVDISTYHAINALKSGIEPLASGTRGDTSAAAARIMPVGLIHPGDINAAIEDAILACTPTHYTSTAIAGACAVAAAIAQTLSPDDPTLDQIVGAAIHGADMGRRYGIPWMGASIARKITWAYNLATGTATEGEVIRDLFDMIGSSHAPADAVPSAFGILVLADGVPERVGMYAAALSGDGDTIGAIAGAIAGTWMGVSAIPDEFIEVLQQANPTCNFETLAKNLYEFAYRNQQQPDLHTLEADA